MSRLDGIVGNDPKMRERVRKAARTAGLNGKALNGEAKDTRVRIRLAEEHVNRNARACARLLDEGVFLRGPFAAVLVRVEELAPGDGSVEQDVTVGGVRHARGALILTKPTPELIQYRLDAKALFQRYDERKRAWVPKSCPKALAQRIVAAATELGFRPCHGIVAVPLFQNGRVIKAPGYHQTTGCIVELACDLPGIPEHPTKVDARRALETMLLPFRGYIEGRPEEQRQRLRCAFAAAVLTAVLRPSLPGAPVILLDGNVPACGKGKAARALAMIATGRHPSVISEGHNDEETEKRLTAAILSGAPALLLDNVQRTLASSILESGLTEGMATIRLFGKLADVTVPCSALVIVAANNASMRADLLRRALPVRIVADTDVPELRRFGFDPYEEAKRDRTVIVAASLTLARAWWNTHGSEEGERIRQQTLGSFERWADLVAGAVEWLTGLNPVTLLEERKRQDSGRGDERAVIEALVAWQAELTDTRPRARWLAKEAVQAIDADLWVAVLPVKGDKPSPKQVGRWLTARKDKVFDRWQLSGVPDRKGILEWTIHRLPG